MPWFIAGAMAIGAEVARISVESRSSARPWAVRARKSALAGATSTRSAQRASSICPIAASASKSSRSISTRFPVSACIVSGVTNSCAARVMTTRTSAPARVNKRDNSAHLYAAIPPVMPSRMRLLVKVGISGRDFPEAWKERTARLAASPAGSNLPETCPHQFMPKIYVKNSAIREIPSKLFRTRRIRDDDQELAVAGTAAGKTL